MTRTARNLTPYQLHTTPEYKRRVACARKALDAATSAFTMHVYTDVTPNNYAALYAEERAARVAVWARRFGVTDFDLL